MNLHVNMNFRYLFIFFMYVQRIKATANKLDLGII